METRPDPKFPVGLLYNTRHSPIHKLVIASSFYDPSRSTWVYQTNIHADNTAWNKRTEEELDLDMFPLDVKEGDIIVAPGAIPVSSQIVVVGGFAWSACYMNTKQGCQITSETLYNQGVRPTVQGSFHARVKEAADAHHEAIFRGRSAAPDYVRSKPYIYRGQA